MALIHLRLFMEQAFLFQRFLFAVDAAKAVHEEGGAEQIDLAYVDRVHAVQDADAQIHDAHAQQHPADLV